VRHHEAVIAADGVLERGVLPVGEVVGIGSVIEGEGETLFVVPVGLAGGKPGEGALVEAARLKDDLHDGVVVGFGDVIRSLFVVGVGTVFKEEAGEAGMLGKSGSSVDGFFGDLARWIVDGFPPAGVGVGAGVEESAGSGDKGVGARFLEAEIAGEAEVGEGVPVVRATGGGGEGRIARQEGTDGGLVGEDCGDIDVARNAIEETLEDEVGMFESAGGVPAVAWNAGEFEEGAGGVGEIGAAGRVFEKAEDAEGFEVGGEFGPGGEAVFAGEDELRVGEGQGGELVG
jgi:hypothetical protein